MVSSTRRRTAPDIFGSDVYVLDTAGTPHRAPTRSFHGFRSASSAQLSRLRAAAPASARRSFGSRSRISFRSTAYSHTNSGMRNDEVAKSIASHGPVSAGGT